VWWIVAIWLSAAVLTGVIRGVFVTGPVPAESSKVEGAPGAKPAPDAPHR